MPPTIGMYSFECSDAAQLAEFWAQVMGRQVDPGANADYATIGFEADEPTWMFVRIASPSAGDNRFMLDLTDPAYDGERERFQRLGAERVSDNEQNGTRWTVFRDPEGNTFRLFAPRPDGT
jgi:catechol 2,3-dioxygenase-like lactoylglutathione lyase family enzyme